MAMAVMMSVIVGMSVIHRQMLYYNITEVHAVVWSQIGALAALIARVLRGFAPQERARAPLKRGRRAPLKRGRREDRVRAAPAVSRARCRKRRTRAYRVQRRQSGLPCAVVLTVSFVLSPVTGFLATVAPRKLASQELDASIGASGPHDFAVRDSTTLVSRGDRVHRIPPRVRDDREPPLLPGGMAYGRRDLGQNNSGIFSRRILDPALV
jgi:hypothetical protein